MVLKLVIYVQNSTNTNTTVTNVPLVEFVYLVFTCMPGELLKATQVIVVLV